MHRDSSANETVSLLLALTGDPRWQAVAISLPKVLLEILFTFDSHLKFLLLAILHLHPTLLENS